MSCKTDIDQGREDQGLMSPAGQYLEYQGLMSPAGEYHREISLASTDRPCTAIDVVKLGQPNCLITSRTRNRRLPARHLH